jgi:iron complex outermembrane recepter protein
MISGGNFSNLRSVTAALLATCIWPSVAFAQFAQQGPPPSSTPSSTASQQRETADSAPLSDNEIVVTARRREERAQDIPIALSVVTEATLEATGAKSLVQIATLVPSVAIQSGNARNTFINIRGLGSNADQSDGLEIGVGIYVDDVYYGRIGSSQFDLIDLERVEVLRGPQGTLFGKNTTAGALNITTRLPTFTPEFKGEMSLGSNDTHELRASASAPILADRVAARLTVADTHVDGYLVNAFDNKRQLGNDNRTLRGQLLLLPSDLLRVRLIGDYSEQTSSTPTKIVGIFTTFTNGARISNNFLDRVARAGYVVPYDLNDRFLRVVDINSANRTDMKSWGASGKIDYDLNSATLTSVTAYRHWQFNPLMDQDQTRLSINLLNGTANRQRQFSQEFRVSSSGTHTLDYVVGAFYYWQGLSAVSERRFGSDYAVWNNPTTPRVLTNYAFDQWQTNAYVESTTKSYAAFGQVNWNASDQLKLTAGLRYTYEDKSGSYEVREVDGNDLSLLSAADRATAQGLRNSVFTVQFYEASLTEGSLTGQLNAAYKVAPDVLLYANYSRGSKSGGFALGDLPAGISPNVKSEKVDAWEVGFKSQFLDKAVTVNGAAFWTEVKNYQAAIQENIGNTTAIRRYISNIPGVRSRGAEADLTVAPSPFVRFTAAAAYVDAVYKDYTNAGPTPESRNTVPFQDLSGVQVANTPKFQYSFSTDLRYPLADAGEAYARLDWSHRSSQNSGSTNSIYTEVPAYGLLNGRIGFQGDHFDVSVYARNLLNKKYVLRLISANDGRVTGYLGDPRAWGVTGRVTF